MAVYPPVNLTPPEVEAIVEYTQRIGLALGVRGLMNVQYVIMNGEGGAEGPGGLGKKGGAEGPGGLGKEGGPSTVYVLEVNPRASRTVPFIAKVTGVPLVRLAVQVMLGRGLKELGYAGGLWPQQPLVAVKAPVFSMAKLAGVDTYLGPEMKSTGEVMGVDKSFAKALAKALLAADLMLPPQGSILVSLADRHKAEATPLLRRLGRAGYRIAATAGTAALARSLGLEVALVAEKLEGGHPNVVDIIHQGLVDAVINTPEGHVTATMRDGFFIRRAAAERRIPCFTSLDTATAAVEVLLRGDQTFTVQPLREYLA